MCHAIRVCLAVGLSFLIAGCCLEYQQTPSPEGVLLVVSDASTGTQIATDTLWLSAKSGDYVDLKLFTDRRPTGPFQTFTLAKGRPGIYQVRVEANGYEPWEEEGVWLRRRGTFCNRVEEQRFEVALLPLADR